MLKVLLYDIEVLPVQALIWSTGKQFVSYDQIIEGEFPLIACIAYKWEHERAVHVLGFDLKKQNCEKLVADFTKIIEEADVVIGHNADNFDMKHINTQRLVSGQKPITWPTSEDTLKQCRKHFRFPSNRLDYIAKLLTGSGKSPMNFQDWYDIKIHKSEKAFQKMMKYCKKDVQIMADAYAKLKPFLTPRASRAELSPDRPLCPSCGHDQVQSKGFRVTLAGKYRRYSCMGCGHSFKDRKKC